VKLLRRLLADKPLEFYLLVILLWLVPALCLFGFGMVYLYQAGWLWWFSLGMLALTLLTLLIRYVLVTEDEDPAQPLLHLEPMADWSERDTQVWQQALANIEASDLQTTPWEELPAAMLEQVTYIARLYRGKDRHAEYAFSLPELLLMLETWSRDYRAVVIENVPLSQDLKISTLRTISNKTTSVTRAYKVVAPFISVARLFLNPASGITSQIRGEMMSQLAGGFSVHMQKSLRQALFEQVSQVAIELYSGRLKLSEAELAARRHTQTPASPIVTRPLSVMIVGQVNAGKSSLVNALQHEFTAGVDLLPATRGFTRYHMSLTDGQQIHLIDTPGLDGDAKTNEALLAEAVDSDLILWVSQANQPAKGLDKQFLDQWLAWFTQHLSRKKPPILLVTTHNDSLPPANEWQPPYDLADSENPKSVSMMQALNYTHQSMDLLEDTQGVPVCLAPGFEPYNIDVLHKLLLSLSKEARAAQLNKERLQGSDNNSVFKRALNQTTGLVKLGYKLAVK
jgi:hypothetical protein